jgi:NADH-quinone oxidoreductase subunit N
MTATSEIWRAAPEILLALWAMGLLMAGAFSGDGVSRRIDRLALFGLVVVALLVLLPAGGKSVVFHGLFVVDPFSSFVKLLVLLGAAIALLMSSDFNRREKIARYEYAVLLLFATLGMMLMVSAHSLLSLYVGLELQSLSLYVIAAFRRDSLKSTEAGLKYFVLGALSSGMLLYGCSLIYGATSSFDFTSLGQAVFAVQGPPSLVLLVGLVFLCAGLAFKVSAVPFHMWTPDVYEGAPTPVTAFFAIAPKIAAIALFTRTLIDPFGPMLGQWQQIILAASVGSMVLGSVAAIAQTNIKRLMAYSSIGHIGYALVGLSAGTAAGVRGVLIYMAIYLAMTAGTFACILAMRVSGRAVESISDLAGLSSTHPGMAVALAIFMFSLAGVPPLAGFFGKFYVFLAAIEAKLYVLAVIGVVASVVGAFYYLRIVKVMYFDDPVEELDRKVPGELFAVMGLSAVFTALFVVYPAPLLDGAERAARALFPG